MRLSVHGRRSVVTDLQGLHARLAAVRARQWTELDLGLDEEEDPGEGAAFFGLIVLISGDRSFLIFFRYSGDAGFSSRDPAYTGPPAATLELELSNGQVDSVPRGVDYADGGRAACRGICLPPSGTRPVDRLA